MNYKVTVLGNIATGDKIYNIECDGIIFENECVVLYKKSMSTAHEKIAVLIVPQNCSLIELVGVQ